MEFLSPPGTPKKPRLYATLEKAELTYSPSKSPGDRFIPNRATMDLDFCDYALTSNEPSSDTVEGQLNNSNAVRTLQSALKREVLNKRENENRRLISCFEKRSVADKVPSSAPLLNVVKSCDGSPMVNKYSMRSLPCGPSRVLDAPDLIDDYYLNLLDWGNNNVIAIALRKNVYLWNASNENITLLTTLTDESDYASSVQWNAKDPSIIAVGTYSGRVQIFDTTRGTLVRELAAHSARVPSLSWRNESFLSSGGRDSRIINYDTRSAAPIISSYAGHEQEICGLSWSPDGTMLASGGNENLLCIWDAAMSGRSGTRLEEVETYQPRHRLTQHQAAVKALAWCPWHRNVLASGGGTADRMIRIWNAALGTHLKCVDTNSQVCALQWNSTHKEIVSSHGFSDNQLILWSYPSMKKIREFKGHTARVLHMSQSPDRTTIISASADETLRFWDLFGVARSTSNIGSKYGKLNQSTTSSSGSLIGSCGLASPVKPALNSSSVHLQIR